MTFKFGSALFAVIFVLNLGASPALAIRGEQVRKDDAAANSLAFVVFGHSHTCSGIVLGKGRILTAAHCLTARNGKPVRLSNIKVFYNRNYYAERHRFRSVAKIAMHPSYVKLSTGRKSQFQSASLDVTDIALLHIEGAHPEGVVEAAVFKDYDQPSRRAETTGGGGSHSYLFAYGFGPPDRKGPGILRRGRMSLADGGSSIDQSGKQRLSGAVTKKSGRAAVCFGDSGGGAFFTSNGTGEIETNNGRPVLAGMLFANAGKTRCSTEHRMIGVSLIYDWIESRK